jgi:hypothetical protein
MLAMATRRYRRGELLPFAGRHVHVDDLLPPQDSI